MEDKYFNENVLKQFLEVLNLPSEIVNDESDDENLINLIRLIFIKIMIIYLENH